MKKLSRNETILFFQSFLITLGLALISGGIFIATEGYPSNDYFNLILNALTIIVGIILVTVAFCGREKIINKLTDSIMIDEFSFIILLIAYPVYYLLKKIKNNI
ncbi:MAG: hypothetical protein MJA31_18710 [Clostridia bacterium]|nr:hypothetical protein [Clostridia bacterium]